MQKIRVFLCSLGIAVLATACHPTNEPIHLLGNAQGTYYSITYYDKAQRNLQHEIDSILDEFDQTASLWVENSLIRRINNNEDSVANGLLADLIRKSNEINEYTGGAFDCTVGKLVRAWGFGFDKRKDMSNQMIDSIKRYTGKPVQVIKNEEGKLIVRKPFPETEIDFNAIAQGYSVDMVGEFLESMGIENYLIDIGGEVIGKGSKPNGESWVVGIEKPADDKNSERVIETAIRLDNQSVVTSGNYRKYYEKDGVRYSHTIDPETGRPVEHTLLSASVVAKESWRADALATAFMVMGMERGLEFLKQHPEIEAAFFIYNNEGEYKTYATEGFEKIISK